MISNLRFLRQNKDVNMMPACLGRYVSGSMVTFQTSDSNELTRHLLQPAGTTLIAGFSEIDLGEYKEFLQRLFSSQCQIESTGSEDSRKFP